MKKFHVNRYGQIVQCRAKIRGCPLLGKHLTEDEKNFITDENYSKGKFNDEQMRLYLDNLNHKYNHKSMDAEEKRQFGATAYDYMRIGRSSKKLDPFRLNVIIGFDIQKELAEERENSEEGKGSSYADSYDFKNLRETYAGKIKPKHATSLEITKYYFKNKRSITVPAGSTIRTTKPSDKDKTLISPAEKSFTILHVNTGSLAYGDDTSIKPVSVTWLGNNGWLYNVEVTQEVLDAN